VSGLSAGPLRWKPDADHAASADDLFARPEHVHLERMSDTHYWLGLEIDGVTHHIDIVKQGRKLRAYVRDAIRDEERQPENDECKHENADHLMPGERYSWEPHAPPEPVLVEQFRCLDCGAWLSLGEANESAVSVIELRAAELAAVPSHELVFRTDRVVDGTDCAIGWHDHQYDADPRRDSPSWRIGWLARQIACGDDAIRTIGIAETMRELKGLIETGHLYAFGRSTQPYIDALARAIHEHEEE